MGSRLGAETHVERKRAVSQPHHRADVLTKIGECDRNIDKHARIVASDLEGPASKTGLCGCPLRSPCSKGHWTELHVHGSWRSDERAELELAAGRVDTEHSNIVGILVGGVEKGPRRIDVHAAGPLPAR